MGVSTPVKAIELAAAPLLCKSARDVCDDTDYVVAAAGCSVCERTLLKRRSVQGPSILSLF